MAGRWFNFNICREKWHFGLVARSCALCRFEAGKLRGVQNVEHSIGAISNDDSRRHRHRHRRRRKRRRSRMGAFLQQFKKVVFVAIVMVASLGAGYIATRCADQIEPVPSQ